MMNTNRYLLFFVGLIVSFSLLLTACTDDSIAAGGNGGGNGEFDPMVDQLQVKVTADVPTAVLSSFDNASMGGALVRRLSQTTSEITPETKMVLIKGEDILNRPFTEWLEAAKIYLRGGYIAVEKPHNAHLVKMMEQLADKMAQAEDELMLGNGITIVRPAIANTATRSDVAARFRARIANIEERAQRRAADEKEAVAELVIFANNSYYSCAPIGEKNIITRTTDKSGNMTTKTESITEEYTIHEMGLQADGAAQWLNHRDGNLLKHRASRRANGSDAINDLMSADEEFHYQRELAALVQVASNYYTRCWENREVRGNANNEIIRVWGVHNIDTNTDYYFVEQDIVASVGGKQDDRFNSVKTLYHGPYEKDKYDPVGEFGHSNSDGSVKYYNQLYGAWFGGANCSMNLSGSGAVRLEDALPATDNSGGTKTISVGSFEATTTTIGGTITPGFSQKMGASFNASATFTRGYTEGKAFMMGTTVNYADLTCQKNTDGTKVAWTYGCGPNMLEGDDWRQHPLAPDALVNDVDINNQACWSVANPEGNYTLNVEQETMMSTLLACDEDELEKQHWDDAEPGDKIILSKSVKEKPLAYTLTLLVPNRSKQIWNMDVTFPEITQDGYNGVKPQLTEALKNQFPSVYQPELILADQTPESENIIKQIVSASKNLLMDPNALQTLREYALTYKISEFTIKWYCAGTNHNTYQLTIKAEGDPDPGKEITRDPVDLSKLTADYMAQDGDVLTGTLGGNYKISVAHGAVVTLDGVTINGTNDEAYNWAGISCQGNAILVLADGSKNVVKGFNEAKPGIHVPEACTLVIQGSTGTLDASSNGKGCGIGSGTSGNGNCGHIEIQGGVITATGGSYCAGIGAGDQHDCGNILISGGMVTATGGYSGAGIGGAHSMTGNYSSCGSITITGGTVIATGGDFGAGIGSGYGGSVSDITLSGGTITAVAGKHENYGTLMDAIGNGNDGSCGNITITKGVTSVTVTGDIGGAAGHATGTVTIEEGANVIRQ